MNSIICHLVNLIVYFYDSGDGGIMISGRLSGSPAICCLSVMPVMYGVMSVFLVDGFW